MNVLGIDPGQAGAMVVEGHNGPYYWAAWSMLRRKGGNVWRCVDSSGVTTEEPTMTHAVQWALQSAPPLRVAAVETWATGSGAKTAAARDGMVRAGGIAQAVVELHRPGVPVLWVQAPTWRRDVLRLRSTAREAAERVAVERMLGEGWTLTQPPAWATVHVAEARGIALWGARRGLGGAPRGAGAPQGGAGTGRVPCDPPTESRGP